jgi:hypothetical protein
MLEHSVHNPNKKKTGQLAVYVCIYTVQNAVYHGERANLISQAVMKCSEVHSLCPFLDKHEMLPVGGRPKNS